MGMVTSFIVLTMFFGIQDSRSGTELKAVAYSISTSNSIIGDFVYSEESSQFVYRYWQDMSPMSKKMVAVAGYDGNKYWIAYYSSQTRLDLICDDLQELAPYLVIYPSERLLNNVGNNGLEMSDRLTPPSLEAYGNAEFFPDRHRWYSIAQFHWIGLRFGSSVLNPVDELGQMISASADSFLENGRFEFYLDPQHKSLEPGWRVFGTVDEQKIIKELEVRFFGAHFGPWFGITPRVVKYGGRTDKVVQSSVFDPATYCAPNVRKFTVGTCEESEYLNELRMQKENGLPNLFDINLGFQNCFSIRLFDQ
jgi:hypothetical protein